MVRERKGDNEMKRKRRERRGGGEGEAGWEGKKVLRGQIV